MMSSLRNGKKEKKTSVQTRHKKKYIYRLYKPIYQLRKRGNCKYESEFPGQCSNTLSELKTVHRRVSSQFLNDRRIHRSLKTKHLDPQHHLRCESKKSPSCGFLKFFRKWLEIFNRFLHTYYAIISTLEYKFLFKYLQL